MIQEEDLSTLAELGLTTLEARAYLALSKTETATIKTIARNANIAKQDLYRIMPRLQKLGLAKKIVAAQAMYKSVSLEEGISTLLESKAQAYTNMQLNATKLISKFKKNGFGDSASEEDSQFHIISEKTLMVRTFDIITDKTQRSIDIAHFWSFTLCTLLNHDTNILERSMKRGARIRWITETHGEATKAEIKLKTLSRNPLFEIRYVKPPIPTQVMIYDQQDAILGLSKWPDTCVSVMWSNNNKFVEVLANYFENLWNSSSISNSDEESTQGQV
jgi:HTH-type transcriptional regulator, sugar sensing transcriptional regulator